MPTVAPVGDEITDGAEFLPSLRRRTEIGQRIVVPANQGLPRRSARTDVKGDSCFRKSHRFLFKWMICLVTPIQGNDIFRQPADEFWMLQNDVAQIGRASCRERG